MMPRGEKRQCLVAQNSLSEVRKRTGKRSVTLVTYY